MSALGSDYVVTLFASGRIKGVYRFADLGDALDWVELVTARRRYSARVVNRATGTIVQREEVGA